jgi:hypothetical protein
MTFLGRPLNVDYALTATTASYSITSSFSDLAAHAISSSYSQNSLTASYALVTSGTVDSAISASFATAAAFAYATPQFTDAGNKLNTTSSISFAGNLGNNHFSNNVGSDTFFFVSGVIDSKKNNLFGTSVFGGDLVISGNLIVNSISSSLGTKGTFQYAELLPVSSISIDKNASYIYTSGSTNDLYFTQYGPPYTNTTRLKWLEAGLSTGLLKGGVLSTINGTTAFSMTAGEGLIVSFNSTLTSGPRPVIKNITWPSYISQSLINSSSAQITYIGIDDSGNIIQRITPLAGTDYQQYIPIGRVFHQSGSVTNGCITSPNVGYGQTTWNADFNRAFGPLKLSGHIIAASGSTLSIKKTGGTSYAEGRNYSSDPNSPNLILPTTDSDILTSKIYRQYISGGLSTNIVIDTGVANTGYLEIDPSKYNLNSEGTLIAVNNNKITIQRVYWFPNATNHAFFVYYGTQQYSSLDIAQSAIPSEVFVEGNNTIGAAILVAFIVVSQDCTDLTDASRARIVQAGIFRGVGTGVGGTAGATVPGGLNTYVQFNDGGSAFNGTSGLTFNKSTNILTSLGGINSGGDIQATGSLYVSEYVTATKGLSGSLQKTATGIPYLIPNGTITITTNSFGQVSINNSIGGSNGLIQYNDNGVFGGVSSLSFDGTQLRATGSFTGSFTGSYQGSYQGSFAGNLSGSLQKLSDGITPYLVAGPNILLHTNSIGQIEITSSTTPGTFFIPVSSYCTTTSTSSNPQVIGQFYYNPIENGPVTAKLRTLLSVTSGKIYLKMFNFTAGQFVDLNGISNQILSSSQATPQLVVSTELIGATNWSGSPAIYELRAYVDTSPGAPYTGFIGNVTLITS